MGVHRRKQEPSQELFLNSFEFYVNVYGRHEPHDDAARSGVRGVERERSAVPTVASASLNSTISSHLSRPTIRNTTRRDETPALRIVQAFVRKNRTGFWRAFARAHYLREILGTRVGPAGFDRLHRYRLRMQSCPR
ncbi:MAG: hypothetical protein BJ554DRAFT_3081 [Olpidium bornovanus]|uniref:Uncharacterized protein n=1 Tax=Olpidium bornovanus TaxID=278681 RepID=A0A8H7ZP00_9FUNG|nr:MAG: hypothetical protein BJ554DRAFT_3081 [Olpidium bornovanus]